MHVTYGRGSVLLWRPNDTLPISGFRDDVISAISYGCSTSPPGWGSEAHTHTQASAWRVGIPVAGSGHSGLFLALKAAVNVLNIYDTVFAHNVSAYIATRKWSVLKLTPQVATPWAESAVYDCLIEQAATIMLASRRIDACRFFVSHIEYT